MTNDRDEVTRPRLWIETASFSDGTTMRLRPGDIVVLVGANNVGKSVALKNIEEKAADKNIAGLVVNEVGIRNEGTADSVLDWLGATCRKGLTNPANPTYTRMGTSVHSSQARSWWTDGQTGLQALSKFFVYHLTTEARLSAANPAQSIALTRAPFTHPIHYLQADDAVEERISECFRRAFGQDLIVHRNAGSEVPLHCGTKPLPADAEDRVSLGYLKRLEGLPTLHSQGDGMRAFVGVLLHTLVVDHAVVLIDEPEAFLHPPQARLLGQMLVRETSQDRQLIVATHSGDFLRGLLDVDSTRVRIVRIERTDRVNPVCELDNDGIRKVWGDPILRHSNVLDGLFHSKVIVCESDADCRFYAAIRDAITKEGPWSESRHLMFTHCGGKGRVPVVVRSLKTLGVSVAAVVDFDVLGTEPDLKAIYGALEGTWGDVATDWRCVNAAISAKKPDLQTVDVRREVQGIFSDVTAEAFPREAATAIRQILRKSSPWSEAKTMGLPFLPRGQAAQTCGRLLSSLSSSGLFVVEVGELEGFARSIGGHGPTWVNAVLEQKTLLTDPELEPARQFVSRILHEGDR